MDAVEAHLDVLRNQALVELARENVEQHQGILGQVRQLEGQGGGTIGDVRQAEARLAEAQNALATALGHLRDAEAVYLAVVGMAAVDLEEGVSPVVAVPESPDAATLASVSSPTVQIADADVDVAEAELRGSRADTTRTSTSSSAPRRATIWTASRARTSVRRRSWCCATIYSRRRGHRPRARGVPAHQGGRGRAARGATRRGRKRAWRTMRC